MAADQRGPGSTRAWLACRGRKVPAEEFAVAVVVGPGEKVEDDGTGVGGVPLASGVVEVAVESAEGGEAGSRHQRCAR